MEPERVQETGHSATKIFAVPEVHVSRYPIVSVRSSFRILRGILTGKRYLIHDRDPLFTADSLEMIADAGVHQAQLAWDGVEATTQSRTPPSCGFDPVEGLASESVSWLDAQPPFDPGNGGESQGFRIFGSNEIRRRVHAGREFLDADDSSVSESRVALCGGAAR